MARQKKQYRPIAGQKWWEKVLDWVTRDENDKYPLLFLALYLLLLIISVYITANIMENFALSDRIFYAWNLGFPPLVVIAFINPLFGLWGLKKCFTLQLPIKDHITQHGPCSYDELVSRFMPFKIHLGIVPYHKMTVGNTVVELNFLCIKSFSYGFDNLCSLLGCNFTCRVVKHCFFFVNFFIGKCNKVTAENNIAVKHINTNAYGFKG